MGEGKVNMLIEINYVGDLAPINQKYCNRRYALSDRYSTAKELIALEAKKAMRGKKMLTGILGVTIDFTYPKSMDIDSPVKEILDAMQHIVYINDSQINCLIVNKSKGKYGAIIRVWERLLEYGKDVKY